MLPMNERTSISTLVLLLSPFLITPSLLKGEGGGMVWGRPFPKTVESLPILTEQVENAMTRVTTIPPALNNEAPAGYRVPPNSPALGPAPSLGVNTQDLRDRLSASHPPLNLNSRGGSNNGRGTRK
ncbi:hypothetical protein IE53DRAFT_221009 [Violaceomyces palustris]|uniref:Uncharacterized protein n=1 Tax=Violaceomyces palustris TaxID=1673888 RepID=A0ACD0NQ76_9BASI|nr:hypothetical protein IE53DRAFT_221009 [Violaceomyces palustris]